MQHTTTLGGLSRRELLKSSGTLAAASALAGVALPQVHAGGNGAIQVALVGCGGRGTGAAVNALAVKNGPVKLVAMADVFPERLDTSFRTLTNEAKRKSFSGGLDVPEDRRFLGFDGYQKAMDCLKAGDVVILTTPPAFRWVHFAYALKKGIHVFMEKPVTVDGPSTRKFLEVATESEKKGLKVGVGLMCRHCPARQELFQRIKDGQLGDLLLLRAYRITGPTGSAFTGPKPEKISDLMYQIRRFHAFLWASGGAYSDFLIHNIDECCWMKDAWPVSAKGFGGRHYRGNNIDQNFDTYSTEFTFPDGTKMYLEGRGMNGCHQEFASYCHGTKGAAVISRSGHWPSHCRTFKGQNFDNKEIAWQCGKELDEHNPYQREWDTLINAIREGKPHNEARRGAEASLVTAMGRMACHTGRIITRDEMLNCDHDMGATVDKLVLDGPSPLLPGADGKYPIPEPGIKKNREY